MSMTMTFSGRSTPTIVAAILLGSALAGAAPAAAQEVTLRFHTHVPPVAGSYKNLAWWAEKVEKDSGGKLKIQMFGSMSLGGNAPDIYDQVKNGTVDLGFTLPGYKAGLFPVTSAFELPFIGAETSVTSQALEVYSQKWGKQEWADVHPIVRFSAGPSVFHMKTKEIKTLADFAGLKIRTPSRISTAAISALGANPVPIPSLKMTEALMRDVVDGVVAPWSIALAIRVIDVANFHTENHLHEPTLVVIMNKDSYAKLSPDLKKVIDANSGEWLAKEFGRRWAEDDKRGRAKAQSLKHPIYTLPDAEEARWRKASQPAYEAWIKEMDGKGLQGRQMVEDAEGLVAKFKAAPKS